MPDVIMEDDRNSDRVKYSLEDWLYTTARTLLVKDLTNDDSISEETAATIVALMSKDEVREQAMHRYRLTHESYTSDMLIQMQFMWAYKDTDRQVPDVAKFIVNERG